MRHILNFWAFVIFLPVFSARVTAKDLPPPAILDDWRCSSDPHSLCHGNYFQDPLPFPHLSKDALKALPLTLSSDTGHFLSEGHSVLEGHVHLTHGNTQLFSDKARIERASHPRNTIQSVEALGHVKLTKPNLRLDGTKATLLFQPDIQIIQNAQFRLYDRHARGASRSATLRQKTELTLEESSYTTCSPLDNTWILKAKKIQINQKSGRGQAKGATLYVQKIPVFYLPYLDFPIDNRRQSGFLYPLLGFSDRSGFELGTPYYWNIAPQYDATLTPRMLGRRGLELQGKFRYLSARSTGEMEGAFLPQDTVYRSFLNVHRHNASPLATGDPRVLALTRSAYNRNAFRIQQDTQFTPNLSAQLRYQRAGDDNYFMDFGDTIGIASTSHLLQLGEVMYQAPQFEIGARLQQYQALHPFEGSPTQDVYKRLPQVSFKTYSPLLPYGIELDTQGEFAHFAHAKEPFTGYALTTGQRFHFRPSMALPIMQPGWYFKPRLQMDVLAYSLTLGTQEARILSNRTPHRALPILDVDAGLVFERAVTLQKEMFTQTLEPRAYYLYIPYRDQSHLPNFDTHHAGFDYHQIYWDNRFSGIDRLGDAHQLTLGLNSRFLSKKTGEEKLTLSAGQITYFQDRKVTSCTLSNPSCFEKALLNTHRKHSALASMIRYSLETDWSIQGTFEWDPYDKKMDKKALSLQYLPDQQRVVNLGYQFARTDLSKFNTPLSSKRLNQVDTSLAWPLTARSRILSRWHYDIDNHRSNDLSFGWEQQNCCTAVRFWFTRFLKPFDEQNRLGKRYSNAVFLQFVFKGMAGVGHQKIHSTLQKSIPGYQWREDAF